MAHSAVWFRRDLRSYDHAALYHALKHSSKVFCFFVFDTEILEKLPSRVDRRVDFIQKSVTELQKDLRSKGGDLWVLHGPASVRVPQIVSNMGVSALYTNRDYEPQAIERDRKVEKALSNLGIEFKTFKDQVIFEADEVLTQSGTPYKVFTAYKNAWLSKLEPFHLKAYPVEKYLRSLAAPGDYPAKPREISLSDIGFKPTDLEKVGVKTGMSGAEALLKDFLKRIDAYHERRDLPSMKGPSYLSVHLRFGTCSIRRLCREAESRTGSKGAETWLSELIWRDFYSMILQRFPEVVTHAFLKEFDHLVFPNSRSKFKAWCEGRTGYPIVDAAMRQMNTTGYMHNRLRMITASFLVKDLHIDWRWGERYFAEKLIDFDLASNNGGWQWSASTGCDAQPYFRIFNPVTQSERFDAEGVFIRRYCPELAKFDAKWVHAPWTAPEEAQKKAGCRIGKDYPAPIADHAEARKITLELYHKK